MSEQITAILKRKLEDIAAYGGIDVETRRNALKEDLQFYVLNFVYNHPEYSKWIMYGGSALRIIHGLDRMSVDLDFEVAHEITGDFLEKLKSELNNHFSGTYGAESSFLTIKIVTGRGLLLKFNVGEELSLGHPSKQVHVKIDLNHFVASKTVTERIPINRDQLSFVIVTYNMAALMASKIAAIFLRGMRGVGTAVYEEKGRDIYDLLWYMSRKIVPAIDYLAAKGVDVKDHRALFVKLTIKMNDVSDNNLKQDIIPLFINRTYIENWLTNWRESYLRFLDDYRINTVTTLAGIQVHEHFVPYNFSFVYTYNTEDGKLVLVRYIIDEDWIDLRRGDLPIEADKKLDDKIEFTSDVRGPRETPRDKLKQYATLFFQKTEKYFKKTNKVIFGNSIITKVVRMTADNLNQKEQIVLDKSALFSCELDDLLK